MSQQGRKAFSNASGAITPMRPCSLCQMFILTGADPESASPYAHCDHPYFPKEIYPGQDVLRCGSFQFRQGRGVFGVKGIGALITTDATSHYETNFPDSDHRKTSFGVRS